jgi:hypothetical protein
MKTRLHSLLLVLLLGNVFSSCIADAQSFNNETEDRVITEAGFLAGGSVYFGDLAADKRNYLSESRLHGGLFIRRFVGRNISLRGNVYAGWLEGNDAWYNDPEWRRHRNFSFKTELYEASLLLEYDVLRGYRLEKGGGMGIYLFAGIGACYTSPRRNFNNIDASYFGPGDDAVSGYEADFGRSPQHVGLVVPAGIGLRQKIAQRMAAFIEGSVRQALDDKIDGFSKSVYSDKYDAYAFLSLGLVISLQRP